MKKLIKALEIFLKYGNPEYPTYCEHDVLYVNIAPGKVSDDDINRLSDLGFHIMDDGDGFYSYTYGSA